MGAAGVIAGGSAVCGRRVTLPMAARRRKVHSTPFPPSGENCVRFLAPPLPGEPASLGFAGSHEGLGKTPPGTTPLIKGRCPEGTEGIGTGSDEHFVLIVAFPRTPFYGGRQLGGLGSRRKGAGSSADTPLLVFRFVVAKSACLRFRLTTKTAPAPLLLLSNANPLRWALRWGPPSAAYIISEFGDLAFPFWERLCCGGAQVVRWGCDTNPSLPL